MPSERIVMQWSTFNDLRMTRATNMSAQVTLEELAAKIRGGTPVVVQVDGGEIPLVLGVTGRPVPQGLVAQLVHPFRRQARTPVR